MDDRKQYAKKVVINIIHVIAQTAAGIKPSEEEINAVPEEFHNDIVTSLMAAREVRKIQALAMMSKAFPIEEILEEAMKKVQSKED